MTLALLSTKCVNHDRNKEIINILAQTETLACSVFFLFSLLALDRDNESIAKDFTWSKQTYVVMHVVSAIFLSMNFYSRWILSLHERRVIILKDLEEISVQNTEAINSLQNSSLAQRIEKALVKAK